MLRRSRQGNADLGLIATGHGRGTESYVGAETGLKAIPNISQPDAESVLCRVGYAGPVIAYRDHQTIEFLTRGNGDGDRAGNG